MSREPGDPPAFTLAERAKGAGVKLKGGQLVDVKRKAKPKAKAK